MRRGERLRGVVLVNGVLLETWPRVLWRGYVLGHTMN